MTSLPIRESNVGMKRAKLSLPRDPGTAVVSVDGASRSNCPARVRVRDED